MATFLYYLPLYLYSYSISFCIFNLLPLYPLDGYRMWYALDKKNNKLLTFLGYYGPYILMGLIAINYLSQYVSFLNYINLLGYAMQYIGGVLSWPIKTFWTWIFTL